MITPEGPPSAPAASPSPAGIAPAEGGALRLWVNGAELLADPAGALVWPARALLVMADLHLEKGSAFAARGRFLPPYDTAATLDRLTALLQRHRPRQVICLGDSFHDGGAGDRLPPPERQRLAGLVGAVDWWWIAGNHDPEPPAGLGGRTANQVTMGPLQFRHQAVAPGRGEVAGHLHPVATVRTGVRRIRTRCFATDGCNLILPAFGAYAGGLNVLDPSFRQVLGPTLAALVIAGERVRAIPRSALTAD